MAAPKLNAFLSALLSQVQKAEDAIYGVMFSRLIGFAVGVQLDAIGRLVGEARLGRLDDDVYRKAIRLRIYVNGSRGRPEDLIYIAKQWTAATAAYYYDVPQAGGAGGNCRMVIPGWVPDTGELLAFLQAACPAGVRLIDVTSGITPTPFRMKDRMKTRLVRYA